MLNRFHDRPLYLDLGWWMPAILAAAAMLLSVVAGAIIGGM